jgi:hypothetical protein
VTIWGDHSDCLTFIQEAEVELENIQGNISEWIAQPNVERKVRRVFVNFLLTYEDEDGSKVYRQRIQDMQSSKLRLPFHTWYSGAPCSAPQPFTDEFFSCSK